MKKDYHNSLEVLQRAARLDPNDQNLKQNIALTEKLLSLEKAGK
jgi:hypothetical protein